MTSRLFPPGERTGQRRSWPRNHGGGVKVISVKLTVKDLELLVSLASDQLFRRECIDPKMPGYKEKPGDLSLGKALSHVCGPS